MSRAKPIYRPMTDVEMAAAVSLEKCKLKNFDRRFSECVVHEARQADPKITDKQANCLWRKIWRFRKQILAQDQGDFRDKVRVTTVIAEVRKRSFITGALDDPWQRKAA